MKLPEKIMMKATMFGDGAKGMAMQCRENEEFKVSLVATRESRDHDFISAWTMEGIEESFETYQELREHVG